MDALIDQVLNALLNAAIYRGVWALDGITVAILGVVVFAIIAYRRSRK